MDCLSGFVEAAVRSIDLFSLKQAFSFSLKKFSSVGIKISHLTFGFPLEDFWSGLSRLVCISQFSLNVLLLLFGWIVAFSCCFARGWCFIAFIFLFLSSFILGVFSPLFCFWLICWLWGLVLGFFFVLFVCLFVVLFIES